MPVLANAFQLLKASPSTNPAAEKKQSPSLREVRRAANPPTALDTPERRQSGLWYAVPSPAYPVRFRNRQPHFWFTAYISNTIASSLAQSNPAYPAHGLAMEGTRRNSGNPSVEAAAKRIAQTAASERNTLVPQTASEAEQKQRLTLLFDSNRNQQLRDRAISRLQELQSESGGLELV